MPKYFLVSFMIFAENDKWLTDILLACISEYIL